MLKNRPILLVLFFVIIAGTHIYNVYSHGHGHDHGHHEENPAYKYSRQANENHGHAHDHHGHAHDHHGHAHDHHGHTHGHDHGHAHDHHGHSHDQVKQAPPKVQVKQDATSNNAFSIAMFSTLLISIAPFLILFFIPLNGKSHENESLLNTLLAFASGSLLGDAFLHLIPHALSPHDHHHSHDDEHHHEHSHGSHDEHDHSAQTKIGLWILAGIMTFFIVEKALMSIKGDHGHNHSHGKKEIKSSDKESDGEESTDASSKAKQTAKKRAGAKAKSSDSKTSKAAQENDIKVSGYLNLAADFAHNFTDGLAIGASYLAGQNIGFVTTLTILLHEVPHEIGDFAILIQSGCSKRKAIFLQLVTALGALSGTLVSLLFETAIKGFATACILPFTAGGFIYIAAVTILPELRENKGLWQAIKELIAFSVGIAMMVVIAVLE